MSGQSRPKQIAVLVRRQQAEALRVAAGLTLAGNGVDVYLLQRLRLEDPQVQEQLETLDLADISPIAVLAEGESSSMNEGSSIGLPAFSRRIVAYDAVISL